jgi:hypothetical protein
MNNIEFSDHKNYTEQYWRNRKVLIENEILPVEESIFRLFSIKFNRDADKDLERKRKKLCDLGKSCSNDLDEIHSIIRKRKIYNENDNDEENAFDMAIEIIDMDYWSVYDFFSTLKAQYSNDSEIYPLLDHICNNISEMRKISKKHTNIISK